MDELTSTMKAWFADMIDTAIRDCEIGVENEQTWADGSRTADEKLMHEANLRENQAYIEFLKNLREKYVERRAASGERKHGQMTDDLAKLPAEPDVHEPIKMEEEHGTTEIH